MVKQTKVAMFASLIMVALPHKGEADEQSKNYDRKDRGSSCYYLDVRATKYHKSEPGCDSETKKGHSSTGVPLQEAGPGIIGTIAADKKFLGKAFIVPLKNGGFNTYVCVDKGGAVTHKKASRSLAKREGRGRDWANRPVIDVYSERSITEDWVTVLVIDDLPLDGLKGSDLTNRLKERMQVNHWPLVASITRSPDGAITLASR